MKGLLGITSVRIAEALVHQAYGHLRRLGQNGMEGFALWVGVESDEVFEVRRILIPSQTALILDHGVCVTVDAVELHRLNVWLFQHRLKLIAQLHSHPNEAYHSETDDIFPIATAVGSLSLVVPDFASSPFSLNKCAVYRLLQQDGWTRLSELEVSALITIVK